MTPLSSNVESLSFGSLRDAISFGSIVAGRRDCSAFNGVLSDAKKRRRSTPRGRSKIKMPSALRLRSHSDSSVLALPKPICIVELARVLIPSRITKRKRAPDGTLFLLAEGGEIRTLGSC